MDENEYIEYVRRVLQKLYKARLFTKISKYNFYTRKIDYLGFVIILEGVEIEDL